jgi:hypothetical protein
MDGVGKADLAQRAHLPAHAGSPARKPGRPQTGGGWAGAHCAGQLSAVGHYGPPPHRRLPTAGNVATLRRLHCRRLVIHVTSVPQDLTLSKVSTHAVAWRYVCPRYP